MTALYEDIRNWLNSQQDWFQEGAQRLLEKGQLTDQDISDLAGLLKTPSGQSVSIHRDFSSLRDDPDDVREIRLVGIDNVRGMENLRPRNPWKLDHRNLNVIYGHNGA